MKIAGIAYLTFGLILSLSKDEAAARPVDASPFDAACGVAQDDEAQDEAKAGGYA